MIDKTEEKRDLLYAKYPNEIEQLIRAKDIEDQIVRALAEIADLKNADFHGNLSTSAGMFGVTVQQIDNKNFVQALDATLENVTAEEIEKAVTEYMAENKIVEIEVKDIEKIAVKLNDVLKEKEKHLTITAEFSNNLRDELTRKIKRDGNYMTKKDFEKGKEGDASGESTTTTTQHDHPSEAQEASATGGPTRKPTLHLHEERREIDPRTLITERELDKKVEETVKGMSQEDIIAIMTDALQKEGSINREIASKQYEKIMPMVAELDKINKQYEETAGEPIYEDVKGIIENVKKFFDEGKGRKV